MTQGRSIHFDEVPKTTTTGFQRVGLNKHQRKTRHTFVTFTQVTVSRLCQESTASDGHKHKMDERLGWRPSARLFFKKKKSGWAALLWLVSWRENFYAFFLSYTWQKETLFSCTYFWHENISSVGPNWPFLTVTFWSFHGNKELLLVTLIFVSSPKSTAWILKTSLWKREGRNHTSIPPTTQWRNPPCRVSQLIICEFKGVLCVSQRETKPRTCPGWKQGLFSVLKRSGRIPLSVGLSLCVPNNWMCTGNMSTGRRSTSVPPFPAPLLSAETKTDFTAWKISVPIPDRAPLGSKHPSEKWRSILTFVFDIIVPTFRVSLFVLQTQMSVINLCKCRCI